MILNNLTNQCLRRIVLSFLIICGLPLGELAMGGQYKVFPKKLRIILMIHFILQMFFAVIENVSKESGNEKSFKK